MYHQHVIHNNPKSNVNISSNLSNKRDVYSKMHFHSSLEFLYMRQGSYLCHLDTGSISVNKGEIIFFNSRTPHATESTTNDTVECIMLQFDDPLKFSEDAKYLAHFIESKNVPYYVFDAHDKSTKALTEFIMTIYNERDSIDTAHDYIVAAKKFEIIAILYRMGLIQDNNLNSLQSKSVQRIMPVIEFIDKNYASIVSLNDIGDALHMNKNYICKIFKIATEKTIMDYLNFVRIEKAKELLKSGLSILEVSSSVGFSSQSYFNKVFQKYILCTPTEYKKRFLNNITNN